MFAAFRFDFLLYYYTITDWPLTLKTLSAMPSPLTRYVKLTTMLVGDNANILIKYK